MAVGAGSMRTRHLKQVNERRLAPAFLQGVPTDCVRGRIPDWHRQGDKFGWAGRSRERLTAVVEKVVHQA